MEEIRQLRASIKLYRELVERLLERKQDAGNPAEILKEKLP